MLALVTVNYSKCLLNIICPLLIKNAEPNTIVTSSNVVILNITNFKIFIYPPVYLSMGYNIKKQNQHHVTNTETEHTKQIAGLIM